MQPLKQPKMVCLLSIFIGLFITVREANATNWCTPNGTPACNLSGGTPAVLNPSPGGPATNAAAPGSPLFQMFPGRNQ